MVSGIFREDLETPWLALEGILVNTLFSEGDKPNLVPKYP